ncbi:MAG: hypothetical protein ACOCXH_02605 [Cyclobacteriaceae bacterium]
MKLFLMNSIGLIFLVGVFIPGSCGCNCSDEVITSIEDEIVKDIQYLEILKDKPDRETINQILSEEFTCKYEESTND